MLTECSVLYNVGWTLKYSASADMVHYPDAIRLGMINLVYQTTRIDFYFKIHEMVVKNVNSH